MIHAQQNVVCFGGTRRLAERATKGEPAWPVPMMIASTCRNTRHLL